MPKPLPKPGMLIAGTVFLLCLAFAGFTRHVWEDYMIAFRSSVNLATGHGLVYQAGERLHSFSSPLGVLVPAGCFWLTGNHSEVAALWLYRVISIASLAAAVCLLFQALQTLKLHRVTLWLTLGLIALDAKIVDFSINGMEIGMLIFFTALVIHGLLVTGPRSWWRVGIGWAGMMWARPDACVYIAALGLGAMLFLGGQRAGRGRLTWLKPLCAAALVCTVLYLPWFLWAWSYYGSPVPHSITAKGANQPLLDPGDLAASVFMFPVKIFAFDDTCLPYNFLPGYASMGGWPDPYFWIAALAGAVAALAWLLPVLRPATRLCSWTFFVGNFYLNEVLKYYPPWYLPIVALFGYLALGCIFDEILCLCRAKARTGKSPAWVAVMPTMLRYTAVALLIGQLAVMVCVARQLQVQQAVIENGLRRAIGLWLHDHARTPNDTVLLEPLGYIGYYSGLRMLDEPGLASRAMVEERKRLGREYENQAYRKLKPDWLVLRPSEADDGRFVDVAGRQQYYEPVIRFDASDKLDAISWLPGRPYPQYDQTFLVFHRKPDAAQTPAQ